MELINDPNKLDCYIKKYHISDFFTKDISEHMNLYHFKRNEYIFKSGESYSHFYFFVEGKAKIYKSLSNGKALLLCFYDGLNILGEVELFSSDDFTTNAQAIDDVYCIGIPIKIVREILLDDSIFLRNISRLLSEKLNRITINSSINQLYPLENKLASYIASTGHTVTSYGKTRFIFNENLSEIAELLGTSYRHLLRTLYTLSSKGVLNKKKNCYEVIDAHRLKQLAADLYK